MEILYTLLESNHGFKGIKQFQSRWHRIVSVRFVSLESLVSCHGTASLCMIEEI